MATSSQRALIIHDASKQLRVCLRSLVIGLSLRYGDTIKLLLITEAFTDKHRFQAKRCGLMFKSKTHSSATINKHKEDIEEETHATLVRYSNSAEFKDMVMVADMLQVEFEMAVEAGMLKEVAVEYAKAFQATNVILVRKLRKELRYFIENLHCGISKVKSDKSIEIVRPPQVSAFEKAAATNHTNSSIPSKDAPEEWGSNNFTCSICRNRRPWNEAKKRFTYAELQIATNGFSTENLMTDHGIKTYLGLLNDQRKIMIRENPSVSIKEDDFHKLDGVRHSNVALLVGSCLEGSHSFLVYEFICNGSLNKHLSERNRELTWEIRLKIIYGAARGLEYLHEQGIYGSMRPRNILITHDFQPLLSYYGLINQYEALGQCSGKKSAMKTFEHLAPEYHETGKELSKADVFSFGVVLLEMITGRKTTEDTDGQSFLRWARPLLRQKKYSELTDPVLKDNPDIYQLYWLVRVADKCLSLDPKSRYSMNKVVKALSGIINRSGVEEFSPTESEL